MILLTYPSIHKNASFYPVAYRERCSQPQLRISPDARLLFFTSDALVALPDGVYLTLTTGALLWLPPFHPCHISKGASYDYLILSGKLTEQFLSGFELTTPFCLTSSHSKALFSRKEELLLAYQKGGETYELFSMQSAFSFLLDLSYEKERSQNRVRSKARKEGDTENLQLLCNYVEDHFFEVIEFSDLCELLRMSSTACLHFFQKNLGMRPMEYINQVRIRHACLFLTETEKTLDEISRACGFMSASYFCTVFRKCIGVSPKVYRSGMADEVSTTPPLTAETL